jgi:hypothetical protein
MVRPSIRLPTAGNPVALARIYAVAPVIPLNVPLSNVGFELVKKYTLFRAPASANALLPMDMTPAGMIIAARALA